MYHHMRESIRERMAYLEGIDERHRADGTGWMERLRQIPAATPIFIALLAVSVSSSGRKLEIEPRSEIEEEGKQVRPYGRCPGEN